MARRGRKSSGRSRGGMSGLMPLLVRGAGAGFSGTIGSFVNKVLPSVAGNTAELVGGAAVYWFGTGVIRQVGEGMLIKAVGDFVEDNVAVGFTTGSTTSAPTSSGATF